MVARNISDQIKNVAKRLVAHKIEQGYRLEGIFHTPIPISGEFFTLRLKHPSTGDKYCPDFYHDGKKYVLGTLKFQTGKPLYGWNLLPDDKSVPIYLVEGHQKAKALLDIGIPAMTSGGSNTVAASDISPLQNRHVILWRDNDVAGQHWHDVWLSRLTNIAHKIEEVCIESLELPEKADVVDWLELHPHATSEDITALSKREIALGNTSNSNAEDEESVPFDEHNLPELSARLLGEPLASFATALSDASETSPSLSVATILGALSVLLAKRFVVSPKSGWQEPINIYTMIALPPANNKSLVLKMCTAPLIQWEAEERVRLSPTYKKECSHYLTQQKRIERLRTEAAKTKDSLKRGQLFDEVAEEEAKLIKPIALPQLFLNDTTVEALGETVHEQNGRLGIISDEGGIIETMSGLYTKGNANVDILLKGIDGGTIRYKRKSGDTQSYDLNPYLSVVLCVQPAILKNMASKKAFSGNGMLERFLYVLPKSKLGNRTHDTNPIPDIVTKRYHDTLLSIAKIEPQKDGENDVPYVLTLESQAYSEWRSFQKQIEQELKPTGRLHVIQGWGGKISGFALRIAGLLHVAKHRTCSLVIDAETMSRALEIAAVLVKHAIAAYIEMETDEETSDAKELLIWMDSSVKRKFTKSELIRAFKNRKISKKQRLDRALQLLVDRGLLTQEKRLGVSKPTTIYTRVMASAQKEAA